LVTTNLWRRLERFIDFKHKQHIPITGQANNYSQKHFLQTPENAFWQGFRRAVNQVSFATSELDFFAVPLPPLAEQRRIVTEFERRLSIADGVEKTVAQSLSQAQRLRHSILKKAFDAGLWRRMRLMSLLVCCWRRYGRKES